jgi:hypothetical protein
MNVIISSVYAQGSHNHGVVFPRTADAKQAHTFIISRRPEDAPSAAHTMLGTLTARTLPAGSRTPLDQARRLQSRDGGMAEGPSWSARVEAIGAPALGGHLAV